MSRKKNNLWQQIWSKLHLDLWLLLGILVLILYGSIILYSASEQNLITVKHQLMSFAIAAVAMVLMAQLPTYRYQALVPWLYAGVLLLLLAVMMVGVVNKGAQRWLNIGLIRFQPSELTKLTVPMMLAWYLHDKVFPLRLKDLLVCCAIIITPVLIIAKQPDLGTAILVGAIGSFVLLLTGISWKIITSATVAIASTIPIIWHFMHSYQKERLFVFLSPEKDPHGSGYNIIQSKIAVGSGGFFGQGWLMGSQTHLHFLPEHYTDFIFAVCGEEFGFCGCFILLILLVYLVGRGLYMSTCAQDTFARLLAGSLSVSFFASFFINICMVVGILPVVGVPLPLVSYGGSSMLIFMTSFGIIMSTYTHRKLIGR